MGGFLSGLRKKMVGGEHGSGERTGGLQIKLRGKQKQRKRKKALLEPFTCHGHVKKRRRCKEPEQKQQPKESGAQIKHKKGGKGQGTLKTPPKNGHGW